MKTLLFIWISTILFFLLAIIWQKSNFINFLLKVMFIVITLWGIFLLLDQYGLIIAVK